MNNNPTKADVDDVMAHIDAKEKRDKNMLNQILETPIVTDQEFKEIKNSVNSKVVNLDDKDLKIVDGYLVLGYNSSYGEDFSGLMIGVRYNIEGETIPRVGIVAALTGHAASVMAFTLGSVGASYSGRLHGPELVKLMVMEPNMMVDWYNNSHMPLTKTDRETVVKILMSTLGRLVWAVDKFKIDLYS